ncbi:extracellular electron transfer flavoprotein PplA [Enterococcus faecalis]|uniref:extracellular electron transfer flavoprotein PplA n=1 Tax=Enterococcus faecalis TaxID=1351 RepID=UPI000352E5FD|nr:extracellular electron transfer flavoprotein PplA [Enterococcus faecalis]EGO8563617.1 FMN-binding protein [Enterococcus faecalis]EPI15196.1 putative FMN-binding domain protein [Enterococcus faecalis]EPI26015.1 putative FMN-binding domain protein [Enterococcus faecalis WKS-26-18-2]UYY19679.1 FMN-binding protein [Enterococcus faecalis]UYY22251.1 FMN-binding protein [Enterococcus faecalis]
MKVNKFVKGFAAIALFSLVLAGCGADKKDNTTNSSSAASSETKKSTESSAPAKKVAGGDLKDGTYKLEEKNEKNGYRAVFEMTVKDGKITESKYDNINADGKSKTEDTKYEESMKAKSGVGPKEYIKQLNDSFVKAQSASGVEVVTGATHSSESFQNYAQQLIQAAQAGNTETIEIDNGAALKDGTYSLKEKNDSNGYHTTFSMTVKDGKVTESNYDNVNADGKSKKDDTEYESKMKDVAGVGPKEYIETLNKEFVKAMGEEDGSPAGVEVVTGATHSTHSFINYAQQLVNAAEKGDTTEIVVDNIVTK